MIPGRNVHELFISSRSRVVRMFNLRASVPALLATHGLMLPAWSLHEQFGGAPPGRETSIWCVFRTHDDACRALLLDGPEVAVASALEDDLEPFSKLRRFDMDDDMDIIYSSDFTPSLSACSSDDGSPLSATLSLHAFPLSTNPPSPRKVFKHGDWMCQCSAHNFGRNIACIACGLSRQPASDYDRYFERHPTRRPPPRLPSILTPSGRAFARGGRIQNISPIPSLPLVMFWPDNEPLPLASQIRPPFAPGSHPPIMNTGNRGPVEHQPGDWYCGKCSYMNWRRRKVCQTCFPFADGNADSVPANAQAERINMLAHMLSSDALGLDVGPKLSDRRASADHVLARPPRTRQSDAGLYEPDAGLTYGLRRSSAANIWAIAPNTSLSLWPTDRL